MIERLDALVLFASDLAKTVAFYEAIGLALETEQHGDGPEHAACDLAGVHIAVYDAGNPAAPRSRRDAGTEQIGFRVPSLEVAVAAAIGCGAEVLVAAEDVPWGRRAVVRDPDGRAVELNEAPQV